MTERRTQVLVIGAGPGGYVAAIRLAQLDRKVMVAEKARVGGVCLNRGCIPTKALLHAVHTLKLAKEATQFGFKFAAPERNLEQLRNWRNRVIERPVRGIEYLFRQYGIELVSATAEFAEPGRVRLNRADGTAMLVAAEDIIIATGSEPAALYGLPPDGRNVITSDEALELSRIPERLLIVGAGAIGLEFASIYAGLGTQVVVVEIMEQVVPGTDKELADLLERTLKKQNIQILLKTSVRAVEGGERLTVRTVRDGTETAIEADQVLVAVGRRPLTAGLAVEKSGARLDARGFIETDGQLRTAQPGVYAIGDVTRPPLLAHKASREGIFVAEQIAGQTAVMNPDAIPAVVYTDPELASVGLTEAQAIAAGHAVAVGRMPLAALGRAGTVNRTEGMGKMVVDRKTDRILGVHILAPEASSLIGEAVVAIEQGLTARALAQACHPHPTFGELLMETAEAVHGRAIHLPPTAGR
jgi:dihydrolipoamide dehydrogenase